MRKIFSVPLHLACGLALAVSAAGCDYVYDEVGDNCAVNYVFTVKAYDNLGTELAASDVPQVTVYLYDETRKYIGSIDTQLGETLSVKIPHGVESYLAIAWGNLTGGSQTFTPPAVGDPFSSAGVSLSAGSGTGIFASPSDLFRGGMTMSKENWTEGKVLAINRETARMNVTIRNLKEFSGFTDNNFSVEVGQTYSALDFNGTATTGETASYRPAGSFVTGGSLTQWEVPSFRMFPGSGLTVKIYHGTELVATINRNSSGDPIAATKSQLTNVLIDLQTQVKVTVELTDWAHNYVWKEF